MKSIRKNAYAIAVLTTTSLPVFASQTAQVAVLGTITPPACNINISGDVNYSNIDPAILALNKDTELPIRSVEMGISCQADTKISLKTINERPYTSINGDDTADRGGSLYEGAGLGMHKGKSIGEYILSLSKPMVDQKSVAFITSRDNFATTNITSQETELNPYSRPGEYVSFDNNDGEIITGKQFQASIKILPLINRNLDTSEAVNLDGLTTIQLYYP